MSSSLRSEEPSLQFVRRHQSGRRELISYSGLHRSIVTVYVSPEKYPFYFHKGRLCQHSSFFEKAFYGSFEEATTGSIYLEEDGVDEFKLFEEWLYSEKFSFPKDSDNPSLLLVKVFCFAEKAGISNLQNATLDTIRDRATEQHVSLPTPNTTDKTYAKPQTLFGSGQRLFSDLPRDDAIPGLEKPVAKYLPPATASAIHYAYQNTPERSPLRKLLADIFAFNVKPETLNEDILLFPAEFMADILLINMKRLPLRLEEEEADFDNNADKYHVHGSHDGPAIEAADPEPKLPTDAAAVNDDDTWGFGGFGGSLNKKEKKKKRKPTILE